MDKQGRTNLESLEIASYWANVSVVALTVLAAIAGVIAFIYSSRLGAVKDSALESFKIEAATKIASADARAAEANSQAAEANERTGKLGLEAAALRERAAKAENEAARLNKMAEDERLARVKIEEKLADRKLTDAQVKAIAEAVSSFTGQEFEMTTFWDLKEPKTIADRIFSALRLSGWKYVKPETGTFLLGGVAGVLVYIHPEAKESVKSAADALIVALKNEDIASELRHMNAPNNPSNKIHINVGTKP